MTDKTTPRIFTGVIIAVIAIALGSFALSYSALLALAIDNGVPARLAPIWPLIVDVSVMVFTAAILTAQLQSRGAKLAIALTGFYGAVTIAGNLLHAPATALGWFVAALPPLSLIFATEMLRAMAHHAIVQNRTAQNLQDLQNRAEQKAAELQTLTAKCNAAQERLQALYTEQTSAKPRKIDDFAEQMRDARQQKVDQRRAEVLRLVRDGMQPAQIAETLGRDVRTIRADITALNGQVTK